MECKDLSTSKNKIKKQLDKIFLDEYLTKTRSNLLYKLGSLRKNHATITSVYSLNGNIYYKTVSPEKRVCMNDCIEINILRLSLLNAQL